MRSDLEDLRGSQRFPLLVLLLIFLLACPPVRGVEKDPGGGRLLGDRDEALREKARQAVEKGVAYLLGAQNEDGSWKGTWAKSAPPYDYPMGETALALLALLKTGMGGRKAPIVKGFNWLKNQPFKKTYEVSVLVMALEARWSENRAAPIEKKDLIRAAKTKIKVMPADLAWMKECVRYLLDIRVSSQRYLGHGTDGALGYKDVWHYPETGGDHSNTQFALLALKSASRCKIPIPEKVWIHTLNHFLEVQEKTGMERIRWKLEEDRKTGLATFKPRKAQVDHARGWAYAAGHFPKGLHPDKVFATTGSMTCVGICCLTIALSELQRKCHRKLLMKAQTGIRDGLAWLDANWQIDTNPYHPDNFWKYYYLYGLERVGVLTWSRHIGKHDWYRELAEHLIERQEPSGAWNEEACHGPIFNTCFALLALARATIPGWRPY